MSCGAPFGNPAASPAREARGLCVPASRRVCLFVDVFYRLYAPRKGEKYLEYLEVRADHEGRAASSLLLPLFTRVPGRVVLRNSS